MPRFCTICRHRRHREIDLALLEHAQSYQCIASRFGVDDSALMRHERAHLAEALKAHKETQMLMMRSRWWPS